MDDASAPGQCFVEQVVCAAARGHRKNGYEEGKWGWFGSFITIDSRSRVSGSRPKKKYTRLLVVRENNFASVPDIKGSNMAKTIGNHKLSSRYM
jgi:hypothetical protein